MSHEVEQESLRFFDDWEEDLIEAWLAERKLSAAWRPTVCGSCCGFYEDEFSVSLSAAQIEEFNAFAIDKGIDAHATPSGIYIGAPEAV